MLCNDVIYPHTSFVNNAELCITLWAHLSSGSVGSDDLGSYAGGSEKSSTRLASFFWKNLRDSLLFLMGLPSAATTSSPCRPGMVLLSSLEVGLIIFRDKKVFLCGEKKETHSGI